MPHLMMEYSANLLEEDELNHFLQQCNHILSETLPANISACKSRAYPCTNYVLADNESNIEAFIAITIKVWSGRSAAILQTTAENILHLAERMFIQSLQALQLKISVEVLELSHHYAKN